MITSFSYNEHLDPPPSAQVRLLAFRQTAPESYALVGKSELGSIAAGTLSTYLTRVGVAAFDVLGLQVVSPVAGCTFSGSTGDVYAATDRYL